MMIFSSRQRQGIATPQPSVVPVLMAWLILTIVSCSSLAFTVPGRITRTVHGSSNTRIHRFPSVIGRSIGSTLTATVSPDSTVSDDDEATLATNKSVAEEATTATTIQKGNFDLATALFCGGLAFDTYKEPARNSSRWERGSQGMNVAFISIPFARSLYKGLIEVTPIRITDLPDEDSTAEGILTGGGVDAYLLVAVVEGQWKEDVDLLEQKTYHDGVLGLLGAAHVGRSTTAWSNIDENAAKLAKKRRGTGVAYHIPSSWGKGGQAVFDKDDEPPFYLYVQDPATARLVFTVMDEDKIGQDEPIGSAHNKLVRFIPDARKSGQEIVAQLKQEVMEKLKRREIDSFDLDENSFRVKFGPKGWQGKIKLTSKASKRDKSGQMALGAAAGAWLAGPAGAAVGGLVGSMYEGEVRGAIEVKLRYLPFPDQTDMPRETYKVQGGLPGVDWGELYERYNAQPLQNENKDALAAMHDMGVTDAEQCFFINHDETGCSCAVYRSLEKRLIAISFRGTCAPKDILTDAAIVQDAWVDGEDVTQEGVAKAHAGFRNSLASISRRLKELVLATTAPGEDMAQYDMLITGHSLGAALATLFVADIAEFGIDAGRALPQLEPSDPWWKSIASTFLKNTPMEKVPPPPPRPKSLRMYNFGSPRVGNKAFCDRFASLQKDGLVNEAYRIVNGEDLVARNPRSINALALGNIGYEHCGATVLIFPSNKADTDNGNPIIWVEGESDDASCPVRDANMRTNPLAEGSLLADLYIATQENITPDGDNLSRLGRIAGNVANRLQKFTPNDVASVVGITREFTEREAKMLQSVFSGEAITHHMEDEYYSGMGRAAGFIARVGEDIVEAKDVIDVE